MSYTVDSYRGVSNMMVLKPIHVSMLGNGAKMYAYREILLHLNNYDVESFILHTSL